ncbi:ferredoxin-type protein NapF [Roseibium sediminis]|uniref:ferredoxin-type protein NapF n=1 Tax=Roseibium sediminis TaxID=1775174 RepID=UPI00123D0E8E
MPLSAPSRRNFLRGRFQETDHEVMRPPGASQDFARLCDGCAACVDACPEGIIVRGPDNRPTIDFSKGECTFCGDCARACPTAALVADNVADWDWKAEISNTCLSLNSVMCRSCEDTCDARAIRFQVLPHGKSMPIFDLDQCIGCGACAQSCPASAIRFTRRRPPSEGDTT